MLKKQKGKPNQTAQISVTASMIKPSLGTGEDMREVMRNASELSLEELNQYAQAQSVSNFYYTLTTSLNGSDNLEPVDTTQNTNNNQPPMFGGDGPRGGMGVQGDFTLIGIFVCAR
jgi:putative ABC transport system permease protein